MSTPVPVSPADMARSQAIADETFQIMALGAADGVGGVVDRTPGLDTLSVEYQKETKDFSKTAALAIIRGIGAQIRQLTVLFNNSDCTGSPASKTTAAFTTSAGTKLLVLASGSGFGAAGSVIGMDLKVDAGATFGTVKSYTNEVTSHKAFVTGFFVVTGLSAASHTITATKLGGTSWDANDFLNITIVELAI